MNHNPTRRVAALAAALTLAFCLTLPASALFLRQTAQEPAATVASFAKNGPISQPIRFSAGDFVVEEGGQSLDSILISTLPAYEAGVLTLGGMELSTGTAVACSALDGLCFQPLRNPTVAATSFTFTPLFSDGTAGVDGTVELYLLSGENSAPVAQNLTLTTYRNVAVSGQFTAVDPEGDLLTFRLVDKPARGSVTLSDEGGAAFTYTPYENKTGKDTFTYVAVDAVGNTSAPATVSLRIDKAKTRVRYADMDGEQSHRAALRLAEEEVFVGECMNGQYFFRPDQAVTRSEFVAMALNVAGQQALTSISRTGFADDEAIPTWAKGYVACALKAGVVKGSLGADGQIVFQGNTPVTRAEASVLLNRILRVTDVAAPTFAAEHEAVPAWAYQAVANLEAAGVLCSGADGSLALSEPMTRADAAQLLAGALDLLDSRESTALF